MRKSLAIARFREGRTVCSVAFILIIIEELKIDCCSCDHDSATIESLRSLNWFDVIVGLLMGHTHTTQGS